MDTAKHDITFTYMFLSDLLATIKYLATTRRTFHYFDTGATRKLRIHCTAEEAQKILNGARQFGAEYDPYCEID